MWRTSLWINDVYMDKVCRCTLELSVDVGKVEVVDCDDFRSENALGVSPRKKKDLGV